MKKTRHNNHEQKTVIVKSNECTFLLGMDGIYSYYASYNVVARCVRRMIRKLGMDFAIPLFYGKWKNNIKNYDLIVLFDNGIEDVVKVAHFIKMINPDIRLVFWYWNPVDPKCIVRSSMDIDEVWTYSRFDAKKYHFKYNPQFYNVMPVIKHNDADVDLVFVGTDKGRKESLELLNKNSECQGLRCDFKIVKSKQDRLDYKDYLSLIMDAKCIVDIVPSQDCGLTLRPLEALFYGKKLITNYRDIVNYDFYCPENVFLIGKDDIDKLADFVNSPCKRVNRKIIEYYCYENWLKRIIDDGDVAV